MQDEQPHCQPRRVEKVDVSTPLIVPSFSSCGFPHVADIYDLMKDKLYGVCLGSVDIYIILSICQQLNYLQNNGRGCWSSFVVSQTCMSDGSPVVSGSSRPSSG